VIYVNLRITAGDSYLGGLSHTAPWRDHEPKVSRAAATGLAVAMALPAGTALGLELLSQPARAVDGQDARASVPVTVTCTLGEIFEVDLSLNQRVGGGKRAGPATMGACTVS
jgi:hypothetical protein